MSRPSLLIDSTDSMTRAYYHDVIVGIFQGRQFSAAPWLSFPHEFLYIIGKGVYSRLQSTNDVFVYAVTRAL